MYQALYRKYRPKNFDEVVGQKYVIETLKNEIKLDKVNHAYMFFGPRGIGKTTIAKIFARAVNCDNNNDGNPCEICERCMASKEKECIDIIEIDAASNNGVDEIREIRNKVNLVPSKLKYKVYIIDEVHMLTQGAFNALLKTLEEPPKHVIFILATTDPQKVSDTIISRCQCFSFKRISEDDNLCQLKKVSKDENIDITDDTLGEIALYSDGGLRDSLGMLDKLSSYKNSKITIEDFYEMNDMIDVKSLEDLYNNIIALNVSSVIKIIEEYNTCGKNIIEIMNQFLYFIKKKVMDYYLNNIHLDELKRTEELLQNINEKMFDIKRTTKPYLYIEIILLRFMNEYKNLQENTVKEKINIHNSVDKTVNNDNISCEKVDKKINVKEKIENKVIITPLEEKKSTENVEIVNNAVEKVVSDNSKSNELNTDVKTEDVVIKNWDKINELMNIRVNNTLAEANKDEKLNDLNVINKIKDTVFDYDKQYLVNELINGNLCASSKNSIIFSYEYESVVAQNLENLDKLTELYNEMSLNNKKIAIITNKEWNEQRNRYIQFTKHGNKYKIKEEPIIESNDVNLNLIEEEKMAAVELFGDIVEIK